MPETLFIVRAVAIVVHDDAVLLVTAKVSPGTWVPPGGKVKRRESAHEAAAREMLEESGLAITVDRLVGYREAWRDDADVLELYFAARLADPDEKLPPTSAEGRQVRWIDIASLPQVTHFPDGLERLCRLAPIQDGPVEYLGTVDLRSDERTER